VTRAVALVPARSGSTRVPGKNIAPLAGHPLIVYTIAAALEAQRFTTVLVSTESEEIAAVARRYGAEALLRPAELATATSPDVDWVVHAMDGRDEDCFALLRPTSPFRSAATIRRALDRLVELGERADSIRAVEPTRQHPAKMWRIDGELMHPVLAGETDGTPWHSMQAPSLPPVFVQNSSLEAAWTRVLRGEQPSIAGDRVAPFFSEGAEGFSVDYPGDLERAEALVARGEATLPRVEP
jgi:CMP-N,N'-diacetyllegionaminic acid synthase